MLAADIIETLGMQRHPEGGWYRQTWAGPVQNGRPSGTAILFLLQQLMLMPQRQIMRHMRTDFFQQCQLQGTDCAGHLIDHTNRADRYMIQLQRHTGIKADMRSTGHQRVMMKIGVYAGIFHHQRRVLCHDMGTKRIFQPGSVCS